MRGFINFSMGYICLCGILGLLIGVPLFYFNYPTLNSSTGGVNPIYTRGEVVGMTVGMSVLFLVWFGIMYALMGKEKNWKEVGWFRKVLLLLMSTPLLYLVAYVALGILFALLVFGVLTAGLLGVSLYNVTKYNVTIDGRSFWVSIRKWW